MTCVIRKTTVFSKYVPKMLKVVFFGIVLCSFLSYSYGRYSDLGDCVPPGKEVSLSYMGKGYLSIRQVLKVLLSKQVPMHCGTLH